MGIKPCKDCGHQVSANAPTCPNCGAIIKKQVSFLQGCIGCFFVFIAGFFGLAMLGAMVGTESGEYTPSNPSSKSTRKENNNGEAVKSNVPSPEQVSVYNEGDSVSVGYTTYAIWKSWWSTKLSDNQFIDEKQNAMYLFVDVTVRNNDKKARMIPPFKLVGEDGAEYDSASLSSMADDAMGMIESLNPSVEKQGVVVFDVPKNKTYRMKISGGYWSSDDAFVQLAPKESK